MHSPVEDRAAAYENRAAPKKQPVPEVLTDRVSTCMMISPKYIGMSLGELMYFPLRARGEPLRFLLHYAGLSYTMRTVQMSEWAELKPTTPAGGLPVFTPLDEEPMAESPDIAKYIASCADAELDLVPTDGSAEAMYEACNGGALHALCPITNFFPADDATQKLPAAVAEVVKALKAMESQKKGAFFNGAKPHYGEFVLLNCVDMLKLNDADAFASLGPAWEAWYTAMCSLPRMAEYLKSRPKAMSGSVGMPTSRIATMKLEEP